jgi:hypothetical protein
LVRAVPQEFSESPASQVERHEVDAIGSFEALQTRSLPSLRGGVIDLDNAQIPPLARHAQGQGVEPGAHHDELSPFARRFPNEILDASLAQGEVQIETRNRKALHQAQLRAEQGGAGPCFRRGNPRVESSDDGPIELVHFFRDLVAQTGVLRDPPKAVRDEQRRGAGFVGAHAWQDNTRCVSGSRDAGRVAYRR